VCVCVCVCVSGLSVNILHQIRYIELSLGNIPAGVSVCCIG